MIQPVDGAEVRTIKRYPTACKPNRLSARKPRDRKSGCGNCGGGSGRRHGRQCLRGNICRAQNREGVAAKP